MVSGSALVYWAWCVGRLMTRRELEPGKTAIEVVRVGTILETPTHGKPGNCTNMLAGFQREMESHSVS